MWNNKVIAILLSLMVSGLRLSALDVGSVAPDIELKTKDGKEVQLSSLKGKIVLVDFWASWCHPCREANPFLIDAYLKYHHKGFEILSISLDENRAHWLNAIEHDKLPWDLHVSDLKGWDSEVVRQYNVEALPTSYLIDRDGKIVALDPFAEDLVLELEEIFLEEISFYPKNATNFLYLSMATKYVIRDSEGKKVMKDEGDKIDVSALEEGLYEIEFAGKLEKFLKKNGAVEAPRITGKSDDEVKLSQKATYSLRDVDGKVFKEGEGDVIVISDLPSGEYYVHLGPYVERILKK